MAKNNPVEPFGAGQRINSVLRAKSTRDSLADLAARGELSSVRGLGFSSAVLADHLSEPFSIAGNTDFFDSRFISEAIILEKTRPVLFVQDGLIEKSKFADTERWLSPVRRAFVGALGSVGRLDLTDHDSMQWCGSAWRIDDDLVITNRHVASSFAQRQGSTFRFRLNQVGKKIQTRMDFREEHKGSESSEFGIMEILWMADDSDTAPDVAVLRILKDPGLPAPLALSSRDVVSGQRIGVAGYPAKDRSYDSVLLKEIFGDVYDVKRFAPGEVQASSASNWHLTHDATTLGGNSGSAVFDLATQQVVGLHFGGTFRKSNYAVKASVIKTILAQRAWISNAGSPGALATEAFTEKVRAAASLAGRTGFDTHFLSRKVSPPKASKPADVLATQTQGNLLAYTHFSVQMSVSRRMAIFTAENIDGAKKIKLKRNDSWGFDPRVPKSAQIGHVEFYGPEPFDKGHMVRRENPGWGDSVEEAQRGEDDTFVYTNAIPQMPQLNQRTWLSLEDYVLDNAKTEGFKISVFTGPVFRDTDPAYSRVKVPTDFWKVVVATDANAPKLLVTAYLLSQEGLMPQEGFRYGPFKTYQVPLSRVEKLAGLKFSKPVREADALLGTLVDEATNTMRFVEIRTVDDIVL